MKFGWVLGIVMLVLVFLLLSMARKAINLGTSRTQGVSKVEAHLVEGTTDALEIEITLWNVKKDHAITEILMPKDLFVALDARTPEGFRNEPAPVPEGGAERAQLEEQNRLNVRWVGRLLLRPNTGALLSIPAKTPTHGAGTLRLRYEGENHAGVMTHNTFEVSVRTARVSAKP